MPLRRATEAGLDGSMPYPWAKLSDIEGAPIAIVQVWGYQGCAREDDKFQVCWLAQLLADQFAPDGSEIPLVFAFSMDADSQDNPRRQWLDQFADPAADPVGPVAVVKVDAQNQQGWVWAIRECPLPADVDPDRIKRVLFRQEWRPAAVANYRRLQALRASRNGRHPAGVPVNASVPVRQTVNAAADDLDDLPF